MEQTNETLREKTVFVEQNSHSVMEQMSELSGGTEQQLNDVHQAMEKQIDQIHETLLDMERISQDQLLSAQKEVEGINQKMGENRQKSSWDSCINRQLHTVLPKYLAHRYNH